MGSNDGQVRPADAYDVLVVAAWVERAVEKMRQVLEAPGLAGFWQRAGRGEIEAIAAGMGRVPENLRHEVEAYLDEKYEAANCRAEERIRRVTGR